MSKTSWTYSTTVNDIKNAGLAYDRCPFCTECPKCLFPFDSTLILSKKKTYSNFHFLGIAACNVILNILLLEINFLFTQKIVSGITKELLKKRMNLRCRWEAHTT